MISFLVYATLYHMDLTCSAGQSLDSRLYRSLCKYTFNRERSSGVSRSMAAAAGHSAATDLSTDSSGVQHCNVNGKSYICSRYIIKLMTEGAGASRPNSSSHLI